jgi:hypothetical protein
MLHGSNMGILALLGVTVIMLGACGLFVAYLARRAASSGATGASTRTPFPCAGEGRGQ